MSKPDIEIAAKPPPGKYTISGLRGFFEDTALLVLFTFRFFRKVFQPPYEISEFLKQSYLIGNKSLALVGITGFIMGLVLTIQSRPTMEQFGAERNRSYYHRTHLRRQGRFRHRR
jgi:ABC-type transporter Mla maintaining outer membrane lipid asymmetry permease subunit MlaE